MTPDLTAATARARQYLTRRRFLGAVGAAGSYMALRGIEEAAVRTVLDPLLADPEPTMPPRHIRRLLTRSEFARLASPGQRALIDGIAVNGLQTIPAPALDRMTALEERDGRLWVCEQCETAARLLFKGPPRVDIPMTEQPDRAFASWREALLRVAATSAEPTFELVRPVVNGRPLRYTTAAAMVRGKLYVVSADEPPASQPPASRSTRPTTALVAA